MDAIKRRAQIHRTRAERIVDATVHMARQIGAPRQHLRWRRPARPFLFRGYAVGSAPAETVAADADAVARRLAVAEHEIEPPLGGVDEDSARGIITRKAHGRARDRARAAAAAKEIRAAAHDVARVGAEKALGLRVTGARQQGQRRKQQGNKAGHYSSSRKNQLRARQAI